MSDTVIRVKNVSYTYSRGLPGAVTAVKGLSIDIERGEFLGIIGHTGSGKSTFIQMLNGLLRPDEGSVELDGQDIFADRRSLKLARAKVGLVFQYPEYQLFEETVRADIAFGPHNMGLDEQEIKRRVEHSAQSVGLAAELLDRSPFELSGGQKRRAAIAGVLAMEPEVLILDEPASGLDPAGRREIFDFITRYHRENKVTVLLISHSMEDIARYAARVLVISGGERWCLDTVNGVFARAAELEKMGLAVPQVTDVFLRLRERGFALPESVYTTEYGAKVLLRALKGGGDA